MIAYFAAEVSRFACLSTWLTGVYPWVLFQLQQLLKYTQREMMAE